MPGFDPTILRDEEKIGGFGPETAGDDTFFLEQLPAYPDSTSSTGSDDATAHEEEAAPSQDVAELEEFAPVAEEEPDLAEAMQAESEPEEAFSAPVEEQQVAPAADTPKEAPPVREVGIPGEPLVLDNSLIDMLKEDLEKSKRKKEERAQAASESETDDIGVTDTTDADSGFESYAAYAQHQADAAENSGEDVVVDITDIQASHPSTYGIEREDTKGGTKGTTETNEEVPPMSQSETEKKRRKVWPFIAGGAVALLAIAAAGYFYLAPKGTSVAHHADSTAATHGSAHGDAHADAHGGTHGEQAHGDTHNNAHGEQPQGSDAHGEQSHGDAHSAQVHGGDTHGEQPQGSDAHGNTHGEQPHADASSTKAHGSNAHGEQSHSSNTHEQATATHGGQQSKTHTQEKVEHKAESTHGSTASKATTPHAQEKTQNTHDNHKADETVAHVAPRTTHKEKTRSNAAETNSASKPYKPQMPPPAYARGEYVIQVYASPSADDADGWLEQLRKRDITDGFITSQLVRGQTWYRVRFGKFSTREEAEAKASKLGFSNIWIVRIR